MPKRSRSGSIIYNRSRVPARVYSYNPRTSTKSYRKRNYSSYKSYVPRTFGNPQARTERKYYDVEYSAAVPAITTTWNATNADPSTIQTLFAPQLGNDYYNRVGRKVQLIALKIRGHVTCTSQGDQTAADPATGCRVLLVQDKQTNGTLATGDLVLLSGTGTQAINMFQNPASFGRFRVYKDKRWILQTQALTYDGTNIEQAGLQKNFEWIIKFRKPITIHFNATNGGTYADIIDNSFHIFAATNSVSLVPTLAYKCRATFLDI